jgi:hypothetical protein
MLHLDTSRSATIVNSQAAVTKENGNPFQCSIFIQDEYRNVRQVELETAEIPRGFYNIRSPLNTFIVNGQTFTIPPGNYTIDTLLTAMSSVSGSTFTKVGDKIAAVLPTPSAVPGNVLSSGITDPGALPRISLSNDGSVVALGTTAGIFQIYERSGNSWNKVVEYPVICNGQLTTSTSYDGNTILTGGSNEAYVYTRSLGIWSQTTPFAHEGSSAFGYEVSLSGDGNTAIIIDPDTDYTYRTYFYYKNIDGSWTRVFSSVNLPIFGAALSYDGNTLLGFNPNAQYVAIYTKDTNGIWNSVPDIVFTPPYISGYFGVGSFLSGDGSTALIIDTLGEIKTASIYRKTGRVWVDSATRLSCDANCGAGLSYDGKTIVIGSAVNLSPAKVYKLVGSSWVLFDTINTSLNPMNSGLFTGAEPPSSFLSGDGLVYFLPFQFDNSVPTTAQAFYYTSSIPTNLTCPPNSLLSLLGFTDGQSGTATNSYTFPFDDYINIWIENVGASSQEFQQITYKIPVTAGTTYWTNNNVNKQIVKNRSYDFPLSKLNIKVLDRFGNQLDNNGQDWSFSIRTSAESP